jgi:hypothetical protein
MSCWLNAWEFQGVPSPGWSGSIGKMKELGIKISNAGSSVKKMADSFEKIQKAMSKLGDIVPKPGKPRRAKVSPSRVAPSIAWAPSISPSEESFSLSVSPSEEDISFYDYKKNPQIAKQTADLAKLMRKSKPKKQEPLPSLLERPKRKFKFDEEE